MFDAQRIGVVVVSMTTIYKRRESAYDTLLRLLTQRDAPVYEVHLYLSHEPYLLDEGFEEVPAKFYELIRIYSNLKIRWVKNTGPYRKLLPALIESWIYNEDRVLITCDDDVEYDEYFVRDMVRAHLRHGCIVFNRGYTLCFDNERVQDYRAIQVETRIEKSLLNLPTGKDGVLYRASYFDGGVLEESAFMEVAPTTDDLWFKWHSAFRGIPAAFVDINNSSDFPSCSSLDKEFSLWKRYNRFGGNDQAISGIDNYFLSEYGKGMLLMVIEGDGVIDAGKALLPSVVSMGNKALRQGRYDDALGLYRFVLSQSRGFFFVLYNCFYAQMRQNKKVKAYVAAYQYYLMTGGLDMLSCVQVEGFDLSGSVLVVVPSYNSEQTLTRSVLSVLSQNDSKVIVVIVDDNSSDGTLSLAYDFERSYGNVYVIALLENVGPFVACNYALDLMRPFDFRYFIKHDADDVMLKDKVRRQVEMLESTSGSYFCTCGYTRVTYPDQQVVGGKKRGHNMTMYRREVFDGIGYYDGVRFGGDSEYLERAISCYGKGAECFLGESLTMAYSMENSLVSRNPLGSTSRIKYQDEFRGIHTEKLMNGASLYNEFSFGVGRVLSMKKKRRICVVFPTYNREFFMHRLLHQIDVAATGYDVEVMIFDDGSEIPVCVDWAQYVNIVSGRVYRSDNHGKTMYWQLVNKIFSCASAIDADYYYYLGDDLEVASNFFDDSVLLWESIDDCKKISLNLLNDGRDKCWTDFERRRISFGSAEVYLSQWLDMIMMFSRDLLRYVVDPIPLSRWEKKPLLSSGVGAQISSEFYGRGYNMYQCVESLVIHGDHKSEMNPEERLLRPLVSSG
jgi:glycosyltransferase involved in cell wall biosynthesis